MVEEVDDRMGRHQLYEEITMASMTARLTEALRGPKGRQLVGKVREVAAKPENREKVTRLLAKFTGRPDSRRPQ